MQKMIPLEKMNKKKQKEYYVKQRGSWYGLSPVTRIVPNGKVYNRNARKRFDRARAVDPDF